MFRLPRQNNAHKRRAERSSIAPSLNTLSRWHSTFTLSFHETCEEADGVLDEALRIVDWSYAVIVHVHHTHQNQRVCRTMLNGSIELWITTAIVFSWFISTFRSISLDNTLSRKGRLDACLMSSSVSMLISQLRPLPSMSSRKQTPACPSLEMLSGHPHLAFFQPTVDQVGTS